MRISERDKQTAHAIAKILGVDLEPWQDFMLQHMLAGYRQPDPPEVEVEVRGPYGTCGAVHPSSAGEIPIRCVRPRGHLGAVHRDGDGLRWPVSD